MIHEAKFKCRVWPENVVRLGMRVTKDREVFVRNSLVPICTKLNQVAVDVFLRSELLQKQGTDCQQVLLASSSTATLLKDSGVKLKLILT